MYKQLFPVSEKLYKMSAHTHSNLSDAAFSPEEVKALYMEKGYSIVAFTDHDVLTPHCKLTDENFVAITAFELEIADTVDTRKRMHFNLLSKDPERDWSSCFNPIAIKDDIPVNIKERALLSEAQKRLSADELLPAVHTTEGLNRIIARAREEGFLVAYNHPRWSCHNYPDYAGLKGLWGVEWFNYGSSICGHVDSFQPIWDLYEQGEFVFPLAADDMHKELSLGKTFLMVSAAQLDYQTVMKALEQGDFYSSNGPEIKSISIENGIVSVETDRPCFIAVNTNKRFQRRSSFDSSVKLDISKFLAANTEGYIRITALDGNNRTAHTRAYSLKEIGG